MKGRISSFQSMGAVDGPGLRFVAFAQGCPLRCAYCHNPETWAADGGSEFTVEQLVEKAERVRPYIKRGGFTLSGGEPLMQPEFAAELFAALRGRGFHTALDTSGCFGAGEAVREVLRHTGLVICDVKFARAGLFKKYCGGELSRTLDFIALTEEMRVPLWIRQVVVPSIKLELLPFRKLCMQKYEALGMDFPLRGVPECGADKLRELQEAAERERAGV